MRATTSKSGAMVVLALLVAAVPTTAGAVDVTDIVTRMQQAVTAGKDMRAKFEFEVINAKSESVYWTGKYYRRNDPDARIRLVFDAPLDLRGTEVAVQRAPDGQSRTRIYLPSVRRVRSVEGDMRGECFLGTDFNYEDLGLQQLEFQQHTLRDGAQGGDRDCYWLESVPQHGWWYGKLIRCVDKKTYLPRRTEYYDRSGVLWKVRTFDVVKKIGSFATPIEITMRTLATGTSTRITLTDIEYDTGLSDRLFESP